MTGELANPNAYLSPPGTLSLSAASPAPAGFHLAIASPLKGGQALWVLGNLFLHH